MGTCIIAVIWGFKLSILSRNVKDITSNTVYQFVSTFCSVTGIVLVGVKKPCNFILVENFMEILRRKMGLL